jgi:hypothetical protein
VKAEQAVEVIHFALMAKSDYQNDINDNKPGEIFTRDTYPLLDFIGDIIVCAYDGGEPSSTGMPGQILAMLRDQYEF